MYPFIQSDGKTNSWHTENDFLLLISKFSKTLVSSPPFGFIMSHHTLGVNPRTPLRNNEGVGILSYPEENGGDPTNENHCTITK